MLALHTLILEWLIRHLMYPGRHVLLLCILSDYSQLRSHDCSLLLYCELLFSVAKKFSIFLNTLF